MRDKQHKSEAIDVRKIMRDFEKSEKSSKRHGTAFKIEPPFDRAIKKILKAKPEPKSAKMKKQNAK